jgi:hypothetical protein
MHSISPDVSDPSAVAVDTARAERRIQEIAEVTGTPRTRACTFDDIEIHTRQKTAA